MQQKIVVAGAAVLALALVMPAAAVVFGGGGGGDSRCDEAHRAYDDLSDEARETGLETTDARAYLVVSAPECFVPEEVARARQHLGTISAR